MNEESSELIRLDVHCDSDAPCVAREALGDVLDDTELREHARLVASELITNAVRYSGGGPEHLLEFRVSIGDGMLLVSVGDPGLSGRGVHLREDGPRSGSGFGLRIVDKLARRWGSERPNGQRVWAELPLGG